MPFCTSCGKEADSGTKFCEYCGAPLEQPAAPAAMPAPAPLPPAASAPTPAPAPVSPPQQPGGAGKFLLIAGIIVVLVAIAGIYFVGLPMMKGPAGKGAAQSPTVNPTPLPVESTTVETAPAPTAATPAALQTYEEKYTETYVQVYATDHAFAGGQREVFTQNLVSPPLYIKYHIAPVMYSGEKVDEYGNMINTTYIGQNSWFKVSVYDASTGQLAEEQGFNKGYSTDTQQEFMVRTPGNYRVEMSGNDVTADVRILTGRS